MRIMIELLSRGYHYMVIMMRISDNVSCNNYHVRSPKEKDAAGYDVTNNFIDHKIFTFPTGRLHSLNCHFHPVMIHC